MTILKLHCTVENTSIFRLPRCPVLFDSRPDHEKPESSDANTSEELKGHVRTFSAVKKSRNLDSSSPAARSWLGYFLIGGRRSARDSINWRHNPFRREQLEMITKADRKRKARSFRTFQVSPWYSVRERRGHYNGQKKLNDNA